MWLELHGLNCFWFTKKELLTSAILCWFVSEKHSTVYLFIHLLNTQSYTYHSYVLSVNALSQPQLCGGFKAVFCQQKRAHVIPRADPSLQTRPFACKLGPLWSPSCPWLTPSLSLTQFCRESASAKPLVTYMLFQQVSCDISAEKPCRKSINVFFIVESHQWRTASHSLSISFYYFLSSLVLLNTLACRAGSAELRSHWLTWVTGMTERTRPCGSCCCHCPPLIDSELLAW